MIERNVCLNLTKFSCFFLNGDIVLSRNEESPKQPLIFQKTSLIDDHMHSNTKTLAGQTLT